MEIALGAIGGYQDIGQHAFGFVGVVVADPGTLLDLGPTGGDRFSHLDRHQSSELVFSGFEAFRRRSKHRGSVRERGPPPLEEGPVGRHQSAVDLVPAVFLIFGYYLATEWIDRLHQVEVSGAGHP